jgi:ribosome-associated translation inhibitor RaiA
MDRPLELAYHNMDSSPEIDAHVRGRVRKLEELYKHIIGCRVTIELQNHTHTSGDTPDVLVNIQVPGQEIIVSRQHSRGEAPLTTVNHAFDAASFQLKEYRARKMGHIKQHAAAIEVAEK